ncbi:MAG: SGNH/GDSL hydrolase family protein [Planctomycetota bacterium]
MAKLLVIGDSISMGYTPHLRRHLVGQFDVTRCEGNGWDSGNVLSRLEGYLAAAGDVAMILVNCGLHDIRRERGGDGCQVPLEAYRRNVRAILERLTAAAPTVVWVRTTPVDDERHRATHDKFDRLTADLDAYNAVADALVADAGARVIDLHQAVLDAGVDTCIRDDGVHMTDDGYARLGACVADAARDLSA